MSGATGPVVGIDLGTTHSLVAIMGPDGPRVLCDSQGRSLIPSLVSFTDEGPLVGQPARAVSVTNAARTVHSVKRLMGRSVDELGDDEKSLAYAVLPGENSGLAHVAVDGRLLTPQEISAMILTRVRQVAEQALGTPVQRVVITVPAYFDDAQRQATRDAAQIAGLQALRVVNEPTAAALAYGLDTQREGTVVVYDLGGGTFDVSVLQITDRVFKVVATAGDTHLGGDDFDRVIMDRILEAVRQQAGQDVTLPPAALQQIRLTAEALKRELSEKDTAALELDLGLAEPLKLRFERAAFEAAIRPLLDKTLACCRAAMKDAGLAPGDVDEVVLVGGSTRIPLVRRLVEQTFGRAPHTELDPDRVVALGAAIQADVLAGGHRDLLLLDVIPLSLGIETMGGAFAKLVTRNTTVPCRATETFSTSVDHQTGIDINVYQGERELVADCRKLGAFRLKGLPPMPAGLPRVEVTFLVDADGVLTVSAAEQRSGLEASIDVVPSHGLTRDQVKGIIRDSIARAREDFAARELVELRNKAHQLVQGTRRVLAMPELPFGQDRRADLEADIARLEALAAGEDAGQLKQACDAFGEKTQSLADDVIGQAIKTELNRDRSQTRS